MKNFIRIVLAIMAVAFTAQILYASFRGDFGAEFAAITNMPWGQVSLVDLYLGFLLYVLAVWLVEDNLKTKLFWAIPIVFLGNAWSLLWVVVRWDKILLRLGVK